MRIVCERSGGFAGLTTRAEVESATLTAAQQRELQTLLEQSELLKQRAAKKRKSRGVPDGFQYDLTVATDETEHTFTLNEGALSEEMLALLDWLMAHRSAKK